MSKLKNFASHTGIVILSLFTSFTPIIIIRSNDAPLIKFLLINHGSIAPVIGIVYYISHKFIFKGLIRNWYWHPLIFTASSYVSLISLFFYLVAHGIILDNISINKIPLTYLYLLGFISVFVVLLTLKLILILNSVNSDSTKKQDIQ